MEGQEIAGALKTHKVRKKEKCTPLKAFLKSKKARKEDRSRDGCAIKIHL